MVLRPCGEVQGRQAQLLVLPVQVCTRSQHALCQSHVAQPHSLVQDGSRLAHVPAPFVHIRPGLQQAMKCLIREALQLALLDHCKLTCALEEHRPAGLPVDDVRCSGANKLLALPPYCAILHDRAEAARISGLPDTAAALKLCVCVPQAQTEVQRSFKVGIRAVRVRPSLQQPTNCQDVSQRGGVVQCRSVIFGVFLESCAAEARVLFLIFILLPHVRPGAKQALEARPVPCQDRSVRRRLLRPVLRIRVCSCAQEHLQASSPCSVSGCVSCCHA
mmetsp:Transcript_32355/g.85580  ORF Transcript_32355/g.85580 Transcript_32355/m.85580 type:complete len:275 (-) Transcript_32355:107-931(-)